MELPREVTHWRKPATNAELSDQAVQLLRTARTLLLVAQEMLETRGTTVVYERGDLPAEG